jgi:signal transduction histidine kinase
MVLVGLLALGVSGAAVGGVAAMAGWIDDPLGGHTIENVVLGVAWSLAGFLIARRARRHPLARLFLVVGMLHSALAALAVSGRIALPAAWLSEVMWFPATVLPVTVGLLLFPDGLLADRFRRWVLVGTVSGVAAVVVAAATAPVVQLAGRAEPNPMALPGTDVLGSVGTVVTAAGGVAALVSLVVRFLHLPPLERLRQAPFLAAGATVLAGLLVAAAVPPIGPALQLVLLPLLPLAATVCVLRFRLWDAEVIVRRWVEFAVLAGLVAAGYVLLVNAAAALLRRDADPAGAVIATTVVALAIVPLRSTVHRVVARALYGRRDDSYAVLRELGARLALSGDPRAALQVAVETVAHALRVPWVEVADGGAVLASSGARPDWLVDPVRTTLVHLGTARGELLVAHRGPDDPLGRRDHDLLAALAAPVAATVGAAAHLADLQRSREQVVVAREEERRRVRRDLHDGLGAALAAMRLQVDVAGRRLRTRPALVPDVLEQLRTTVDDAVRDVRRVVEGLRPPALDDLGLLRALTEHAARLDRAGAARVLVTGNELPALPAAVEVAAYWIAVEALSNALRHADATRIEVSLRADREGLRVSICDDGRGLNPGTADGSGLGTMRERAEEIGGCLSMEGPPGTGVHVVLPCGAVA